MVIGLWCFQTTARMFLRHAKVQTKKIVLIFFKTLNVGFGDRIFFFFQIFQFTRFLDDLISSDLHEISHAVLMGQFMQHFRQYNYERRINRPIPS